MSHWACNGQDDSGIIYSELRFVNIYYSAVQVNDECMSL